MNKIYIIALLYTAGLFGYEDMYWTQDRPFTGLPPFPTDIYRPPANPLRKCQSNASCANGCAAGISRNDILTNIRQQRCCKNGATTIVKPRTNGSRR